MAQDAGYEAACGVITGKNGKYNLWRISFGWHDSMRTFAFRLTPWYNRLLLLRRWAREDTVAGNAVRLSNAASINWRINNYANWLFFPVRLQARAGC